MNLPRTKVSEIKVKLIFQFPASLSGPRHFTNRKNFLSQSFNATGSVPLTECAQYFVAGNIATIDFHCDVALFYIWGSEIRTSLDLSGQK